LHRVAVEDRQLGLRYKARGHITMHAATGEAPVTSREMRLRSDGSARQRHERVSRRGALTYAPELLLQVGRLKGTYPLHMSRALNPHDALEDWQTKVAELAAAETLVCARCVTDPELWRRVEPDANRGICQFCHSAADCASFDDLAGVIEEVLNVFYVSWSEPRSTDGDGSVSGS